MPLALTASAILLCKEYNASTYTLYYTAEGLVEDVEAELVQVRDVLTSTGATSVQEVEQSGTDVWTSMLAEGTVVRVGVAAKDLSLYIQENSVRINEGNFVADMSSGCLYAIRTGENAGTIKTWLAALRQPAVAHEGYTFIMHQTEDMQHVEHWGYRPQALDVMKRLKQRWDPAGILVIA